MDVEQVRALAQIMQESGLSEIVWRQGDARLILRRGLTGAHPPLSTPLPATTAPPAVPPAPATAAPAAADAGVAALVEIKSPMVGTFYAAPEPDAPPFVKVGSEVGPESVVCIVEAMKVFNEIKAETAGVIERVLVQSGHPVEFGQPLFLVRRHT